MIKTEIQERITKKKKEDELELKKILKQIDRLQEKKTKKITNTKDKNGIIGLPKKRINDLIREKKKRLQKYYY